jgi:3-oxoacyl-[acyl-carrier-protein] synthase II
VSVLIAGSASLTCLGDDEATFTALLRGDCGVSELRYFPAGLLNVRHGYHIGEPGPERAGRAGDWLVRCVTEAARQAGLTAGSRVAVLVGSGLRALRDAERWAADSVPLAAADLHFGGRLGRAVTGAGPAVVISSACAAAGCALALGQDLLELGDADAVIVAGADSMTESMLAMIGRFSEEPADRIRPFDADRPGVLLGEGAAAVVLVPEHAAPPRPLARLLGCGLSCDARYETAPDLAGIARAMTDALDRAGRDADQVDLVLAHGTGTQLNDQTEAEALGGLFAGARPGPLVTALKGALGHTSGASALTSLTMGIRSLRSGQVPPIAGLREPFAEGSGLRLVSGAPVSAPLRLIQVDAFGFGGVNAVALLESA